MDSLFISLRLKLLNLLYYPSMRISLSLLLSRFIHLSWYTFESPSLLAHIRMMHLHELRDPFLTVTKLSVFWHIFNFLKYLRIYSFLLSSIKIGLICSKEARELMTLWSSVVLGRRKSNSGLSSIYGKILSISSLMVLLDRGCSCLLYYFLMVF